MTIERSDLEKYLTEWGKIPAEDDWIFREGFLHAIKVAETLLNNSIENGPYIGAGDMVEYLKKYAGTR